jgi:hypothetical protein
MPDSFNYAVRVNMASDNRMNNECAAVGGMGIGRGNLSTEIKTRP